MTNEEKRDNYTILKVKLKKALNAGFYFEACMIEYAIIEDRTSSILFHAGVSENAYSPDKLLAKKLKSIETQINSEHPIISKKIDAELINLIRDWKDRRNEIVHRACTHKINEEELESIAFEGKELTDKIVNASRRVTNLANKLNRGEGK